MFNIVALEVIFMSCALAIGETIPTDEMHESLKAQLAALEGHSVSFVAENYAGRGTPQPPESGPTKEHFVARFHCRSIIMDAGLQYRYELHMRDAAESLDELIGTKETMTWNGAAARSLGLHPDRDGHGDIQAKPPVSHYMEMYMTWQGWWVFQLSEKRTFADMVKSDRTTEPELRNDGSTIWHYVVHDDGAELIQVELVARRDGDGWPRLTDVILRGFADPYGERRLRVKVTVAFQPPLPDEPTGLARSAELTYRHFRNSPDDTFWQVGRITLESTDVIEPTPDLFTLEFTEPMTVSDGRYRIGYQLGTTRLNLDGRLVITHIPLEGDVGDNLEWWVKHGTMVPLDE